MKIAIVALGCLLAMPAFAQDAAAPCARKATAPGFEAWGTPGGDALGIGTQATLALKPATSVHFEPRLARAPKDGTFGGYFAITVPVAGTYRFALSDGAWIDAVFKGQRLHSAAHDHGPACSGIAKIVAFQLQAGKNYIQLSEAKAPRIGMMVVKG